MNFKKMTLFVLAGQSNMAGRGEILPDDRIPVDGIYMMNRVLQWIPASEPVHFDKPCAGAGIGFPFAKILRQQDPDTSIGLIPCAVGGSPIASWKPGALDEATGTHPYDDAILRIRAAKESGGTFGAILWHQGESDSVRGTKTDVPYKEKLRAVLHQFRTDIPELQQAFFLMGELVAFQDTFDMMPVNQALRELAVEEPRSAFVPAPEKAESADQLHFNNASLKIFAAHYAEIYGRIRRKI